MQASYGSKTFEVNEVGTAMATDNMFGVRGGRTLQTRKIDIIGKIHGDTQAILDVNIKNLRNALQFDGRDFKLLLNDGATISDHSLINAQSISGTRVVVGPTFDVPDGAEYSTFRSFKFSVEADFLGSDELLAWEETLTSTGNGGPRIVFVELQEEPPQAQIVNLFTRASAVQSGSARGKTIWPASPPPIFPEFLVNPDTQVSSTTPTFAGRGFHDYRTSWNFRFEAGEPLLGIPTIR